MIPVTAIVIISATLAAPVAPTAPAAGHEWATPHWRDFAAHIVAGEAEHPGSRLIIACTLVNDIERRGWAPWALRGRWFGWSYPDKGARRAVRHALDGGCQDVPLYVYVGCPGDIAAWRRSGLVGPDEKPHRYGGGGIVAFPVEPTPQPQLPVAVHATTRNPHGLP